MFISWPLFIHHTLPLRFLSSNFPIIFPTPVVSSNPKPTASTIVRITRTVLSILVLAGMALAVHKNTVLHPYLLADNRHYPFYLFRRTILRHSLIKYLAVPLYFSAGWAVINVPLAKIPGQKIGVLWMVAYLVAFMGGVVGAGLVEFRYFVPGWVMWRITAGSGASWNGGKLRWRWMLEIVWFAVVNWVTAALFLYRGFKWESEPGKVQRFMW